MLAVHFLLHYLPFFYRLITISLFKLRFFFERRVTFEGELSMMTPGDLIGFDCKVGELAFGLSAVEADGDFAIADGLV